MQNIWLCQLFQKKGKEFLDNVFYKVLFNM